MFRRTAPMLLILLLASNVCGRGYAASTDQADVAKTLDSYQKALAARDVNTVMSLWSTDPKIVMMGTGPGERWVGPANIRAAHRKIMEGFRKEAYKPQWRSLSVMPEVAWVAGESLITDHGGQRPVQFWLNWTAVLEKQDGNWRIVQLHYSNLTPPGRASSRRR